MDVDGLLWDFGDTLCDERFIWGSGPEWMKIYGTFDDGIGDQWCTHDLDTAAFATELAQRMERPHEEIVAHMVDRSTNHIVFYDYTYSFFKARHLPQAIVTVNPDLFSEVIVVAHDLDSYCDTIVTSWEERTVDKAILCELAVERMPFELERGHALLIDNKQTNVEGWREAGGLGYHYTTDAAFRHDIEHGTLRGILG